MAGRLVMAGGSFAVSAIVARLLSPAEVGVYFLALSLSTVLALIARGGLEKTLLQLVANSMSHGNEARAAKAIALGFGMAATGSSIVAVMVLVGLPEVATAWFGSDALVSLSPVMVPWFCYLTLETLMADTFRGLGELSRASIAGGAASRILLVICLLILFWRGDQSSLLTIVLTTVAAGWVALTPGLILLVRRWRSLRFISRDRDAELKPGAVFTAALPLFVMGLTFYLAGEAGLWILSAFRPVDEVALYAVSLRLVLLIGLSLAIVDQVLPPFMSDLHARGDHDRLEGLLRVAASVAGAPAIGLLVAFALFGGEILGVLFGPYYVAAGPVLAILSVGQIVNVAVGSCGYMLIMTGHQKDLMRAAVFGGSITVAGGFLLAPAYGAGGVAVATSAGTVAAQLSSLWLVRIRCGIWTHAGIRPLLDVVRSARGWLKTGFLRS